MKKLKKIVTLSAVLLAISTAGFSQNSHALIGVIFKSKPVKVVGAVGSIGGGLISILAYNAAINATTIGVAISGALYTGFGMIIAGVGLIILDDHRIADIEFKAIDPNQPDLYAGFSRQQVETYNAELDQLNAIRQTMIAETSDEANTADAEDLWKKYSTLLSKDTVEIAQRNAANFLRAIR